MRITPCTRRSRFVSDALAGSLAVRHGGPVEEPPTDVWLGDDPDLALVRADMRAWAEAHDDRCECEAICVCEDTR